MELKKIKFIGHTPNNTNHFFCHLKNIRWLNFIFFNSIQLAKLYGTYFCRFFDKKYFTLSDLFFVMYDFASPLHTQFSTKLLENLCAHRVTPNFDDLSFFFGFWFFSARKFTRYIWRHQKKIDSNRILKYITRLFVEKYVFFYKLRDFWWKY